MTKSIGRPEQEALQQVLVQCRQVAGLTQRDLAKRLDTWHSRIHEYEVGERRLDLIQLRDYVAVLGLSLPEFVLLVEQQIERTKAAN